VGSRRNPTLYKLVFDETTDFPDFEITLRSLSIKKFKELESRDGESQNDLVVRTACFIAGQMVSWNREDEDGTPLPATEDSLLDEEPKLIFAIVNKWTEAIAGVPAPLDDGSDSGEISPVESSLTELPSESLAS
jgi:hypothetical protein